MTHKNYFYSLKLYNFLEDNNTQKLIGCNIIKIFKYITYNFNTDKITIIWVNLSIDLILKENIKVLELPSGI